jgi:hypothetical protein
MAAGDEPSDKRTCFLISTLGASRQFWLRTTKRTKGHMMQSEGWHGRGSAAPVPQPQLLSVGDAPGTTINLVDEDSDDAKSALLCGRSHIAVIVRAAQNRSRRQVRKLSTGCQQWPAKRLTPPCLIRWLRPRLVTWSGIVRRKLTGSLLRTAAAGWVRAMQLTIHPVPEWDVVASIPAGPIRECSLACPNAFSHPD